MTKHLQTTLVLAVFLITFFVRLEAVKQNNLPFTTDQGRDLIDIRNIAVGHNLRLIGPTTSINGVYLGPFWYYFNLPPFLASGGDPAALLYWQIIWYQLAGFFLYLLIRKSDELLALFASVLFLLMPLGFNTSRYFWNANAMPIFSALFLLALFRVKVKPSLSGAAITGLLAGLALQIEAAFGVIFFPFSFLYLFVVSRKPKIHLVHLAAFFITLLPQILFEILHRFPMTRVFLSETGSDSQMLGQTMTLTARLADRVSIFINLVTQVSHLGPNYLFPIFAILLVASLSLLFFRQGSKVGRQFLSLNLLFLVFAALFYLVFPKEIKNWYLLGLSVPIVFLFAGSLRLVFDATGFPGKTAISILITAALLSTIRAQSDYLRVADAMGSNNKSSLKNGKQVLDWVYQHAQGQGFFAYNYLPSVYDFPYQYLYWWYGKTNYGYLPNDIAYLPNQPEYIEDRLKYLTPVRDISENRPTFLIIEADPEHLDFQAAWLGNFAKLCPVDQVRYSFGIEVRKMVRCPPK